MNLDSMDRVVCIMSYTSSASGLMASLFDNHPAVLMFPDNCLAGFQDFWQENSLNDIDLILDNFLERYSTLFDSRVTPKGLENSSESGDARGFNTLGADRSQHLWVDSEVFRGQMKEVLGRNLPILRKNFFRALHLSYAKAQGRQVHKPVIVFGLHSLEHPQRTDALLEDFPDAFFLTMVRNPVLACASRFRRQIKATMSPFHFRKIILGVMRGGTTLPTVSPQKWKGVRMEDLHTFPEETMKKVSQWLDIPWSEAFLQSTIHGKQWWNEKGSMQVSGFNTAIANQTFDEYLAGLDKLRLYILLNKKVTAWGYSTSERGASLLSKILLLPLLVVPFKVETMSWGSFLKRTLNEESSFTRKLFLSFRQVIGGYCYGRIWLVKAWCMMFNQQGNVVILNNAISNEF